MFANTQSTAIHMGIPDVCKTPIGPVITPLPYPNIAMTDMAEPVVLNVMIEAMPVHNMMTMVEMSNGDQAGVLGGVVSNMIMGQVKHLLGSFKVMFMATPATMQTSITVHNGLVPNAPGLTMTPSQCKVVING